MKEEDWNQRKMRGIRQKEVEIVRDREEGVGSKSREKGQLNREGKSRK